MQVRVRAWKDKLLTLTLTLILILILSAGSGTCMKRQAIGKLGYVNRRVVKGS